jgi:uncharacterized membrane protein HdeD (DUF308 family)
MSQGEIMASATSKFGSRTGGLWTALLLFGLAVTVLGVLLIINPFAAATTLALLIGAALVVTGITEVLAAVSDRGGASGVAFGLLLTIGGIVALLWPGITLWTLALLIGASFILAGAVRAGLSLRARRAGQPAGRGLAIGAVLIVIGLIAIVWPSATVFILAVLFGIVLVIQGASQIALAMALRGRR